MAEVTYPFPCFILQQFIDDRILLFPGRFAWKGRVAADNDDTFRNYMVHVMSQVEEQTCPTPECQHCKDEEGVTFKPKEDGEKTEEERDNNNNNNNNNDNTNNTNNNDDDDTANDKFSLDEFHLLHSRLHGQGLEEAEKTQGEEYAKLGTLSPRKEWLERRRANAKAHSFAQSTPEPEKSKARGLQRSNTDPPQGQANSNQTPPKPTGDFRNYKYRQPDRDYRSPHNGYVRPQYGYGGSKSTNSASVQKLVPMEMPRDSPESYMEPKPRRSGYQYSSVNYHNSEKKWTGDHEGENEGNDHEEVHQNVSKGTSLGYQSSQGTPQWNSAIKSSRVSRDTSRDTSLSSTWPRSDFEHQQEDVHTFQIPTNLRGTKDKNGSNGLYPEISKGGLYNSTPENANTQPYIYRKPSLTQSTTALGNSEKKKDRFSHIQSRYSVASYKPGNPRRKVVISGNKRRSFVQDSQGRRTPGRGVPRDQRSQNTSKSARYNRQENNY